MVDPQDALSGISREASGAPPEGIMQGRNRTLVIQQISKISDDPFQEALTIQSKAAREFGGTKVPFTVSPVGGKEINTAESAKIPTIPEVRKGSIADIIL